MIIVIGAGISGLTAAWHLKQKGKKVLVLEASQQAGGLLQTLQQQNLRLELGPNSILADADLLAWLRELGLDADLEHASEVSKSRFIYKNGQIRGLPSNPMDLLKNNFFSLSTKLLLAKEPFRKAEKIENETISAFFLRRFNREVLEYAVKPFVGGIYAGNPDELLLKYTFPSLLQMEAEHGSVIRGLVKSHALTRKTSLNFAKGMQQLPQTIAQTLEVVYNSPVTRISGQQGAWCVHTPTQEYTAETLILAAPAKQIAEILPKSELADVASILKRITYAQMHVVHTSFEKTAFSALPKGFGVLHPANEGLFSSGTIWTSAVFPKSSAPAQWLFTSFVGGMQQAEYGHLSAPEVKKRVLAELTHHYKAKLEPVYQHHTFWPEAIPQYTAVMNDVENAVNLLTSKGLLVCANWHGGPSVSDCIKKGKLLAEKL